ncbi:sulfite exporter TauE/SafE family protein [Mucilaginibacter humi]|uniref:sulfite exporter TauE/SafE family protein n=1 Tax=Mucilaginibacter humi TaxID=2732510 RepID=UPI00293BEA75|nr:sulfite exporter TauE/SafE family protein [Mucilaginibacter humi]
MKLNSSYPTADGVVEYGVANVAGGFFMMLFAGVISGLLGIGSGALKVMAMDGLMRIPFKVSTTTSNFMIGVTAAASAVVYLQRGYIDPGLSMPVVIGVLLGAMTGSKILVNSASSKWIRIAFSVIVGVIAIQMIYNGIIGKV